MDALTDWKLLSGGLMVFYGNGGEFRGEAFERWLAVVDGGQVKKYIGGTGDRFILSSTVRARGREPFKTRGIPFATITDDRLVRGFVTTGAWFGLDIAAFSWAKSADAMRWLDVSPDLAQKAHATLLGLRTSVEADLAGRTKRA